MSVITVTVTGVIAPAIVGSSYETTYGIDFGGFFGPAGGNLAGDPFTVVWTGIDCNCAGTNNVFDPVIDAVLTINGHTYDFGSGLPELWAYNSFRDGDHELTIGHLRTDNGGLTYIPTIDGSLWTAYAGYGANAVFPFPGRDGEFHLQLGSNTAEWTQAFLTVSVPGPMLGTGLPGLMLVAALVAFASRRSFANHGPISRGPTHLGVSGTGTSSGYAPG
jgi:hypothetical protein